MTANGSTLPSRAEPDGDAPAPHENSIRGYVRQNVAPSPIAAVREAIDHVVRYNPGMSRDEKITRRWRLQVRELLYFTTTIAAGLGSTGYATKNSVSTFAQFVMFLGGLFILSGCFGAFCWWLSQGTTQGVMTGFVLGVLIAGPALLLLVI